MSMTFCGVAPRRHQSCRINQATFTRGMIFMRRGAATTGRETSSSPGPRSGRAGRVEASLLLDARTGLGPAVDDRLLDVGGDGLVGAELHGVGALTGGHALEVGGVTEDLAQGDRGL